MDRVKAAKGVKLDTQLDAADLKALAVHQPATRPDSSHQHHDYCTNVEAHVHL
jgi:hypothetical protein